MRNKIVMATAVLSLCMVSMVLAQQGENFEGTVEKVSARMATQGGNLVFDGVGLKLANYPNIMFVVAKKDIAKFKLGKKLKGGDYEVDPTRVKGKQVFIAGSQAAGAKKEIQVLNLKIK